MEVCALTDVCPPTATDGMQKTVDGSNVPKSVETALRTRNKRAKHTVGPLKCIKVQHAALHTEK
jgi:hypothetical protein